MTRAKIRSLLVASVLISLLAVVAIQPAAASEQCVDGGERFDSPDNADCEATEAGGGMSAVDKVEIVNAVINAGKDAGLGTAGPVSGGGGSVPQLKGDFSDPEGY